MEFKEIREQSKDLTNICQQLKLIKFLCSSLASTDDETSEAVNGVPNVIDGLIETIKHASAMLDQIVSYEENRYQRETDALKNKQKEGR